MKRTRGIPLVKPAIPRLARPTVAAARWRPLTLAWRKLSRSVTRPTHAHRAMVRNRWSPHFSLHLKLAFIAPGQARRPSILTSFASAILRRHWLTHQTALRQVLQWSRGIDRLQLDRIVRDVAAREHLLRSSTQTEIRKLFKTRMLPLRVGRAAGRSPQSVSDAPRARSFRFVELISVRRSHDMFRTRRHVVHVTAANRAGLVLAPRRVRPVEAASRPPDLVWRTESQPFTFDAIERSISAATSPAAPFSGSGAPAVERMASAHTLPAAGKIDPALLDRVAEDVIGRVERRIRIERERRGV